MMPRGTSLSAGYTSDRYVEVPHWRYARINRANVVLNTIPLRVQFRCEILFARDDRGKVTAPAATFASSQGDTNRRETLAPLGTMRDKLITVLKPPNMVQIVLRGTYNRK